jgi:ZIP family zinc transporter
LQLAIAMIATIQFRYGNRDGLMVFVGRTYRESSMHELTHALAAQPHRQMAIYRLGAGAVIVVLGLLYVAGQLAGALDDWHSALPAGRAAALQAGLIAALATALGALPALFMGGMPAARTRNALLGFSAGVMLAAAAFSLLLPAIDFGSRLMADRSAATALAVAALIAGVAAMLLIERMVPHSHDDDAASADRRGVWLMVIAIAIHNFPEGLAIGAALAGEAGSQAVTFAIALQDMPEGLIVAASLVAVGMSRWRAFAIGAGSGLAEPLAAWLSSGVIGMHPALYPIGLAVAAGTMLFVVSHEMIPATHRRGGESVPTLALTAGFAAMLIIDSSFG